MKKWLIGGGIAVVVVGGILVLKARAAAAEEEQRVLWCRAQFHETGAWPEGCAGVSAYTTKLGAVDHRGLTVLSGDEAHAALSAMRGCGCRR